MGSGQYLDRSAETPEFQTMSNRLQVNQAAALMAFLCTELQGWSRNKIKRRLQEGCVVVNGEPVSRQGHLLEAGDEVEVLALPKGRQRGVLQLEVLYSDDDLIAINKPAGLLSVASNREDQPHALAMLRVQFSEPRRAIKLWPAHRLDRDTSGVLLFATSREIHEAVTGAWSAAEKNYLAVVEGCPSPRQGTIDQALRMDSKGYRAHVGPHPEAKRAVTHFETQRTVKGRSLLALQIETGRQHQIRAHLAWLGHPVVGDSRYGTGGRRLGLHALRLSIPCPKTGRRLDFAAPVPDGFLALLE
jgi:23S rRNA pseudouridine1911/1915/1917 synthase